MRPAVNIRFTQFAGLPQRVTAHNSAKLQHREHGLLSLHRVGRRRAAVQCHPQQ